MAYEADGQKLDDSRERVATEELVATAELSQLYGMQVPEVISEVKDEVVSSPVDLGEDQIMEVVRRVAASRGINLSDEDLQRVMGLAKELQELGYDEDTFSTTLSEFETKLQEVTKKAQEQGGGVIDAIGAFFQSIIDWFSNLFGGGMPSNDEITQSAEEFFQNFNTDVFEWDNAEPSGH